MAGINVNQLRIAFKNPCRFATTGTVSLTGSDAVDGASTLNDYDRILVKDHSTPSFNGIWIATGSAWFRALDFNSSTEDSIQAGVFTYIQEGTANAEKTFTLTTTGSITLGTTSLVFSNLDVTGSGGASYFDSTTAGSIFTTGSAAFVGAEGIDSPVDKGTDTFFYVSGAIGSKDTATAGTTLIGGDAVVSGTVYILSSTYISNDIGGGLLTPAPGTDFPALMVEIDAQGSLKYAAHFKNEGESAGDAIAIGFSNRTTQYSKKGAIAYERDAGFGRGHFHILQNSTADPSDADLTDKVATFYNDGRGEVYGDWKTVTLTGSLTHLNDGTSYLIAGSNITITSESNGSVTIASTGGGGGATYFDSTTAGSIFTTGSAAFVGSEGIDSPVDKGTDVFFYVSGATDSRGGATAGVALFGGDVVSSGSVYIMTGSELSISGAAGYIGNALSSSANVNIDWNASNKAKITMGTDVTFTFTDPPGWCSLQLVLVQDATGGRSPTFPASILWQSSSLPAWSTGSNTIDIVSFLYDGTNYYAAAGNLFGTA